LESEQRMGIIIGSHIPCIDINLEEPISDMPKATSTNQATLLLQQVAHQSASSCYLFIKPYIFLMSNNCSASVWLKFMRPTQLRANITRDLNSRALAPIQIAGPCSRAFLPGSASQGMAISTHMRQILPMKTVSSCASNRCFCSTSQFVVEPHLPANGNQLHCQSCPRRLLPWGCVQSSSWQVAKEAE
jgi:hypothetical protein